MNLFDEIFSANALYKQFISKEINDRFPDIDAGNAAVWIQLCLSLL